MAEQTLSVLRRKAVEAKTGLSTSGLYDAMAAGTFPKPIRLSAKAVGWRSNEVDDWILSRPSFVQERPPGAIAKGLETARRKVAGAEA
jgi:prophage regulatory protein